MKTNDYLLLAATGAYSFLFYQQNAGINFLLFTIILLAILVIKNKKLLSYKKWVWSVVLCLVSAMCVFVHSSALSIIGNVFSLLLLSAVSFNVATSSLFSFAFSCYSVISSVVYIIIDTISRFQLKSNESESKRGYKALATVIVLVLSVLFFSMYKNSNPLFAENTNTIFTILGEAKKDKKGFWWNFYVDYFYTLANNHHTEALCYYITQSKGDTYNVWLKDNLTKMEALSEWYTKYLHKF